MAFAYHSGNHGFCAYIGSDEVYVDYTAEVFDVHFFHRYAFDYSGVVHKDVDGAYRSFDVGHHGTHGFFIGDVAEIAFGVDAEFFVSL